VNRTLRTRTASLILPVVMLMACARQPVEILFTDSDSLSSGGVGQAISSLNPGDRVRVITVSGEEFDANFLEFDSEIVTFSRKDVTHAGGAEFSALRDKNSYHQAELRELAILRRTPKDGENAHTGLDASDWTIVFVGAACVYIAIAMLAGPP